MQEYRAEETGRVESTRRIWCARSHLALRRESRREDEALGEATIESKTTAKKRTLELELRSRASLGANISELVACRGLNEAEDASVDVVAHEAPAKVHVLEAALEVSMLKQRDGASVVFSDRRRARLDEA